MANKVIFLSHIHEEQRPAADIKAALEDEFGGLVDVFVASDNSSIPTGALFPTHIDNALATCVGAIYLISPESVKRSWINFELGAVWMRKYQNGKSNLIDIPTIPMCHSGITPSSLPMPLSVLQGGSATSTHDLKRAFTALQVAVGGRGSLKTDFEQLATKIRGFERSYTVGNRLNRLLQIIRVNPQDLKNKLGEDAAIQFRAIVESHLLGEARAVIQDLQGYVDVHLMGQATSSILTPQGHVSVSGTQYLFMIQRAAL